MTVPLNQQILDLIKKQPGISTEELASKLECEPVEIRTALLHHISTGQVKTTRIDGADGKTSTYTLNPSFLGWNAPATAAEPAAAPVRHTVVPATKTDKAIAYLQANGRAVSADLANAMGLPKGHPPHNYLAAALRDGRIARDGKIWILGSADQPQEPSVTPPQRCKHGHAGTTQAEAPTPPPPHAPREPIHSSLAIGSLQIIQWRDGSLVVSANDNTIDLNADQALALRAFVKLT